LESRRPGTAKKLQALTILTPGIQAGTAPINAILNLFSQLARKTGHPRLARVLLYIISAGQYSNHRDYYPPLEEI
jgi:hypothetical protein